MGRLEVSKVTRTGPIPYVSLVITASFHMMFELGRKRLVDTLQSIQEPRSIRLTLPAPKTPIPVKTIIDSETCSNHVRDAQELSLSALDHVVDNLLCGLDVFDVAGDLSHELKKETTRASAKSLV
jgi:hypothetical protein